METSSNMTMDDSSVKRKVTMAEVEHPSDRDSFRRLSRKGSMKSGGRQSLGRDSIAGVGAFRRRSTAVFRPSSRRSGQSNRESTMKQQLDVSKNPKSMYSFSNDIRKLIRIARGKNSMVSVDGEEETSTIDTTTATSTTRRSTAASAGTIKSIKALKKKKEKGAAKKKQKVKRKPKFKKKKFIKNLKKMEKEMKDSVENKYRMSICRKNMMKNWDMVIVRIIEAQGVRNKLKKKHVSLEHENSHGLWAVSRRDKNYCQTKFFNSREIFQIYAKSINALQRDLNKKSYESLKIVQSDNVRRLRLGEQTNKRMIEDWKMKSITARKIYDTFYKNLQTNNDKATMRLRNLEPYRWDKNEILGPRKRLLKVEATFQENATLFRNGFATFEHFRTINLKEIDKLSDQLQKIKYKEYLMSKKKDHFLKQLAILNERRAFADSKRSVLSKLIVDLKETKWQCIDNHKKMYQMYLDMSLNRDICASKVEKKCKKLEKREERLAKGLVDIKKHMFKNFIFSTNTLQRVGVTLLNFCKTVEKLCNIRIKVRPPPPGVEVIGYPAEKLQVIVNKPEYLTLEEMEGDYEMAIVQFRMMLIVHEKWLRANCTTTKDMGFLVEAGKCLKICSRLTLEEERIRVIIEEDMKKLRGV